MYEIVAIPTHCDCGTFPGWKCPVCGQLLAVAVNVADLDTHEEP